MEAVPVKIVPQGFGETRRRDWWWIEPMTVFVVFGGFLVYGTWAAFQNAHYTYGPYLSPFYSPELWGDSPHAWFGPKPAWWPAFVPFSPALLILPFPGLFRFTCYYYRGAYYKAFWTDPPSCAVGEPRKSYWGEHSFPLILQNVHRYSAVHRAIFLFCSPTTSGWRCGSPIRRPGRKEFGIGVGTLVLAVNVVLLSSYTLGATRSGTGRWRKTKCRSPVRRRVLQLLERLNGRHMLFAWMQPLLGGVADVYVRLCSMGDLTDARISDGRRIRATATTSSSSAPAAPACARRSKRPRAASRSASSASRFSARRTP